MSLTNDDIQLIKGALKPEFANINEHFEKVELAFTELEGKMNQRFDSVDKVLEELIRFATEDVNELHENHERRITRIEDKLHIS